MNTKLVLVISRPESVIESAKTVIKPLKTVCPTAGVRPFYYFWFEEMQEG